jgi:hypothetical protein
MSRWFTVWQARAIDPANVEALGADHEVVAISVDFRDELPNLSFKAEEQAPAAGVLRMTAPAHAAGRFQGGYRCN